MISSFTSAQQLLVCSVASQECWINRWDLELLITGNDLIFYAFENPDWFYCMKASSLKFARNGGKVQMSIEKLWVRIPSTAGGPRSFTELGFEKHVSVLRWLAVISDCNGTRVEKDRRSFRHTIHTRTSYMSSRIAQPHLLYQLGIYHVGLCNAYVIIIISGYFCTSRCFRSFSSAYTLILF